MRSALSLFFLSWPVALLASSTAWLHADGASVSAKIVVKATQGEKRGRNDAADAANVVVWLVPLQAAGPRSAAAPRHGPYVLRQKNKQFSPHLLVVPTGANVEFPNDDPFFHNVFSLFNGKRFDLGLYETGTNRSVRFDRDGVSYIFCNIHPEMGAVVVALSTPYFGTSSAGGDLLISGVPAGEYTVNVWGENVRLAGPAESHKIVRIANNDSSLGEIVLERTADPMRHHKNKFGEEYPRVPSPSY